MRPTHASEERATDRKASLKAAPGACRVRWHADVRTVNSGGV